MKHLTIILIAATVLAASTSASARPMHHRHKVCSVHHHHRVCAWR